MFRILSPLELPPILQYSNRWKYLLQGQVCPGCNGNTHRGTDFVSRLRRPRFLPVTVFNCVYTGADLREIRSNAIKSFLCLGAIHLQV